MDSRDQKSSKIYVSNLSVAFTEDDFRRSFQKYGKIENIHLKSKDTFSFGFIEYSNTDQAQEAINAMNRKELDGKQIKVEFSRNRGNRDGGRGGRFGDRGDRGDRGGYRGGRDRDDGYRGGRDRDDRGPRRDFGDRPKGCFNCGKDGHFARDCQEPRKPRDSNNNRDSGRDNYRERNERRRSRSRSNDRHKKKRRSSSGSSRS